MLNGHNLGIVNLTTWQSSAMSTGRWGIGADPTTKEDAPVPGSVTQEELAALQKQVYEETIRQIRFQRKMSIVSAVGIGVFALGSLISAFRGR